MPCGELSVSVRRAAMDVEREFEVRRPVGEVFAYLADVTNEARWNPWAKWVRKVGDAPIGRGAVFRGEYQGFGELEQDLSVYEPPNRLVYHSIPKGMEQATMAFELAESGTATRVRIVGESCLSRTEPGKVGMGLLLRGAGWSAWRSG